MEHGAGFFREAAAIGREPLLESGQAPQVPGQGLDDYCFDSFRINMDAG